MALYLDGKEVSKVSTFAAGAKAELAGLMRVGKVTTATSSLIFESLDLRGQDDNAFEGWYVSVLQADNVAPEGQLQPMSAYESSTGKVTHSTFTADLAVGDWVVLLRPEIAMLGKVNTAAAEGPVTSVDYMMGYIKQLINIYQLADPDLDPSVLDDSPFAQLLAIGGDVSDYNDNTDSLEALGAEVNLLKSAADGVDVYPASVQNDSIIAKMLASGNPANANTFNNTTDSLEAIRDAIDALVAIAATDMGVLQTLELSVTSAANAGADTLLATVASGSVIITEIVVFAVAAQTGDMTSAPVKGGAAKVITFLAAADIAQADVDAADKQVYWSGKVRLNTGDTIVMEHNGTNTTALNLVVAFTFYASSADGATMS